MSKEKEVKRLLIIGIIAAFATLSFIGTTIIRIPVPATGGYFNLGDTFVMISALLYGPIVGAFVGLIGPALSDAIGFPQFILATAVIKSIEGLLIGIIGSDPKYISNIRTILALIIGSLVIIIGYYIFEAYVYPALSTKFQYFGVTDKNAAIAELFPNTLQASFSSLIAFGIWKIFKGRKKII